MLSDAVLAALPQNPKGDPLEVARFAGIQAAKRTADLIPMCHPLPLSFIDVSAVVVAGGIEIRSTAATVAGTGVEMEALTAAAVAALTIYDMCKAMDKSIAIREIVLVQQIRGQERRLQHRKRLVSRWSGRETVGLAGRGEMYGSCVQEGRTADPSATLGMTKGGAVDLL